MTTTDMTPTCQNRPDTFTTAGLIASLDQTWTAVRTRHPDVPAVVIVVASGSPTKASQNLKWGHFASLRWQHGAARLPEVLVSGEGLSRAPADILTTLLHEAGHGLADTRNIKDTSRQGRWHNKHFAVHAQELGLTPSKDTKLGWSLCALRPETAGAYRTELDQISTALGAYRHPELVQTTQRASNNNGVSAECACPRKIRISLAGFDAGPILCGVCNTPFTTGNTDGGDPA